MVTPKLSIIIVNYNTKDLVVDCLESIEKEGSNLPLEIIVVDNGSMDGSVVAVEKSIKGIKSTKGIKGKIIKNKENLGFAIANNQGIKKAKGKYTLLLNSDTRVKRGAFNKLVEFAEKTSDAGVVGAKLLNKDGSVQESCFNFPTIKRAMNQFWLKNSKSFDKFAPKSKTPTVVDAVVGAAFLITPAARKKVGLLDERYFMYFEDLDYCRRVWKAGLKVYYLPSSEVIHYHGESGKGLGGKDDQWKRLIPSSKIYHGLFKHYLIVFIMRSDIRSTMWSGQKLRN